MSGRDRLKSTLPPAVALAAAVVAVYANALHGGFVWDDINSIAENPAIEHVSTVLRTPGAVNTASGRPLVALSLALNYAVGGSDTFGYHVVNVLIHVAAALTLFGFARGLARLPRWRRRYEAHATALAWLVAATWALHPLQTEAVTYVIQRAESLMGLCYLLTLYLFLRSEDSPHAGRWRLLSVAACALGMTAKEVMVSAPVMVLLFDRTFFSGSFRRALASKRAFYVGLFATWIILAVLVLGLGGNRGGSTGGFSARAPWAAYWLTQFPAIATYLKLSFFPHPLIFQYGPFWLPSLAAALPTALIVVPLAGATVLALVRWPPVGFFGFWFFSILAVTSLVPGISDMIAEHRMYLALAPLWILVAAALYRWRPAAAFTLLGAAAALFAAGTVLRNRDYRSEAILLADNVARRPANALTRYNLGVDLLREPGGAAEGEAQLEIAVRLRPDFPAAQAALGESLMKTPARRDDAIAHLETAVRLNPADAEAEMYLAILLLQSGDRLPGAIALLEDAERREPGSARIHHILALALATAGRRGEARAEAGKALQLDPKLDAARVLLNQLDLP